MALTFDYSRVNNARFAESDLQINKKTGMGTKINFTYFYLNSNITFCCKKK